MIAHPLLLFLTLFFIHFSVGLVAYVERRMKPLYAILQMRKQNTYSVSNIAKHYEFLGVNVPDVLLIEPEPFITGMLRRFEARVNMEISALLVVAIIPSSVLTALLT